MSDIKDRSKEIVYESWDTPVSKSNELWLVSQIFTTLNTHFFFKRNHDSPENEYHVLTIRGDSPFKIIEEGLGYKVVGDLLENDISPKNKQNQRVGTYKVWNTQFANESFGGLAISEKEYDRMEKFQYIISTNDDWIQFVTFRPMKWAFHEGIKLNDLVMEYLQKDSLDD